MLHGCMSALGSLTPAQLGLLTPAQLAEHYFDPPADAGLADAGLGAVVGVAGLTEVAVPPPPPYHPLGATPLAPVADFDPALALVGALSAPGEVGSVEELVGGGMLVGEPSSAFVDEPASDADDVHDAPKARSPNERADDDAPVANPVASPVGSGVREISPR